jgi:hypothetical protein
MGLIEEPPAGPATCSSSGVSKLGVLTDALIRVRDGECVVDPTIVARLVRRARPARQLAELTEPSEKGTNHTCSAQDINRLCPSLLRRPPMGRRCRA